MEKNFHFAHLKPTFSIFHTYFYKTPTSVCHTFIQINIHFFNSIISLTDPTQPTHGHLSQTRNNPNNHTATIGTIGTHTRSTDRRWEKDGLAYNSNDSIKNKRNLHFHFGFGFMVVNFTNRKVSRNIG